MNLKRTALLACLVGAGIFVVSEAPAASHGGGYRVSHAGNRLPAGSTRPHRDYRPHAYWRWGLGLGIGVPLALGWYDPWFGWPVYYPAYYPSHYHGPAYRRAPPCALDDDCGRAEPVEPTAPTTEVLPAGAGEGGGPTQRPLHLNYCDSARAWFPQVKTCPGGWRLAQPEYARDR